MDTYAPPTEPWLPVVHQDRDLLVIDKPAGLLSVPGRQPGWADSALSRAQELVGGEPGDQGGIYAVHRLDMDTSGLLVLALRRKAERALRAQFAARTVEKTYLARVAGQPDDAGLIDLPLRRVGGLPPKNVVDRDAGKRAVTRYEVRCRDAEGAVLALFPETGRSHQLRVHLAALGFPIVGDRLYGGQPGPRMLLHAWRLSLDHPWSGDRLDLEAPLPPGLAC